MKLLYTFSYRDNPNITYFGLRDMDCFSYSSKKGVELHRGYGQLFMNQQLTGELLINFPVKVYP